MQDLLPLAALGPRIMICGPSNAGKSTLAVALGQRLGTPAIHLDLLFHEPNTNWVARPKTEFETLHNEAIGGERWIIEGNYFATVGPRLQRATGIVLLGTDRWLGFARYVRRTLFERERAGKLEGGIDRLNWRMTKFILVEQPRKRERDRRMLKASGLPMVELESMRALQWLYEAWQLQR